jgi:hypothetical protein
MRRNAMRETMYGYRLHPRETEHDPHLATIMYTNNPPDGPWHDMATCHPDWIDDILGSLQWRQDQLKQQQ